MSAYRHVLLQGGRSPFSLAPSPVPFVLVQVEESPDNIYIHKDEIVGDEQQFIAQVPLFHPVTGIGGGVKQQLQDEYSYIKRISRQGEDEICRQQQEKHQRGKRPTQHTVTDILETKRAVAENIEQALKTPDRLQAAGCYPYLPFLFFFHVQGGCLCGIGILAVGNLITFGGNAEGEDKVV